MTGKHIVDPALIEVDGVDLTNHFRSITVNSEFDEVDITGFGSAYRENAIGLGTGSFTGEVFQDYADGSVDATLWPLSQPPHDTFVVRVQNNDGTVEYTITARLPGFTPLDGAVGAENATSVTFSNASDDGITRTDLGS